MKTIIIIPARYDSSRFPGKPLVKIKGKEMMIRVADICAKVIKKKNVYIATEDIRIMNVAKKYNYNCLFTSKKCLTGTDRVSEVSRKINSEIYINVQGDEPLVRPNDIKKIILAKKKFKNYVICGYCKISNKENPKDQSIPKVVFNKKKELIYISRSLIPGSKIKNTLFFKQVCIYAYNKNQIKNFYSNKKTKIENIEDIEIIRFLEKNIKIKMIKTSDGSLAVDYKKDVKKIENLLSN